MKRLLVTGGTGTLGGHILRQATQWEWNEIHSTFHNNKPTFQKVFWHFAEARSGFGELLKKIEPTHIVHTLAVSLPDECEKDKMEAWRVNVNATKEIAEYSARTHARIVYTSTDMVFDGEKGNYTEEDEAHPVNFYGDTKLEGEKILLELAKNSAIVRISLLYGLNLDGKPTYFSQLIEALKKKQEVKLFGDQIRTMIAVDNAAACILELAHSVYEGIIHIGGPEPTDRFTFGKILAETMNGSPEKLIQVTVKDVLLKAKRPQDVSLHTGRAQKILRTKILSIKEGINEFFKRNPL